jgi:hypothetical protein
MCYQQYSNFLKTWLSKQRRKLNKPCLRRGLGRGGGWKGGERRKEGGGISGIKQNIQHKCPHVSPPPPPTTTSNLFCPLNCPVPLSHWALLVHISILFVMACSHPQSGFACSRCCIINCLPGWSLLPSPPEQNAGLFHQLMLKRVHNA